MINTDEEALICDMAETYHIYDYKQLRPKQAAIFASGLSRNSRIKRKMAGQSECVETLLLASIADSLRILVWFQSEDGQNNTNRPESILGLLTDKGDDAEGYDTIEEYEAARKRIMES